MESKIEYILELRTRLCNRASTAARHIKQRQVCLQTVMNTHLPQSQQPQPFPLNLGHIPPEACPLDGQWSM